MSEQEEAKTNIQKARETREKNVRERQIARMKGLDSASGEEELPQEEPEEDEEFLQVPANSYGEAEDAPPLSKEQILSVAKELGVDPSKVLLAVAKTDKEETTPEGGNIYRYDPDKNDYVALSEEEKVKFHAGELVLNEWPDQMDPDAMKVGPAYYRGEGADFLYTFARPDDRSMATMPAGYVPVRKALDSRYQLKKVPGFAEPVVCYMDTVLFRIPRQFAERRRAMKDLELKRIANENRDGIFEDFRQKTAEAGGEDAFTFDEVYRTRGARDETLSRFDRDLDRRFDELDRQLEEYPDFAEQVAAGYLQGQGFDREQALSAATGRSNNRSTFGWGGQKYEQEYERIYGKR